MSLLFRFWLALAPALLAPAAKPGTSQVRLVYRTLDQRTTAVAYDFEGDSPVELTQLGSYGPSVLRRVKPSGETGGVIWRVEGETNCPVPCGVGLESLRKLGGYAVLAVVGVPNRGVAAVYLATDGKGSRLLARSSIKSRPQSPEENEFDAGVPSFERIESIGIAEDGEVILINGARSGDGREAKTYALAMGKDMVLQRLDGKIVGSTDRAFFVTAGTRGWKELQKESSDQSASPVTRVPLIPVADTNVLKLVQAGNRRAELRKGALFVYEASAEVAARSDAGVVEGSKPVQFSGCGADTNRTHVTGVWTTKRGTFMAAVDSDLAVEEQGRVVYGGRAHCLYEIE
jgi:hypothetical protein